MAKEVSSEISIIPDAREKGPREVTNEVAKIVEELEASLRKLEEQERQILGKFFHQRGRRPSSGAETLLVTKTPGATLANTLGECPLWRGGGDR